MTIREGAQRVRIYNSGHLVFLYDEANRTAINEAAPEILYGFRGEADLNDEALQKLANEGTLVIYELRQDDELDVEIVLGEPLSVSELSVARWKFPQQARLAMPSGKLCIESYDSLLLGDDDPTDPGAVLDVPPGDYTLTLHRIAWGAMDRDDISDGYEGPYEIIMLTPADEQSMSESLPAFLRFNIEDSDDR
jgi:hypothetical protein